MNETRTTTAASPSTVTPSVKRLAIVVVILIAGILLTTFSADVTRVSEAGIEPVLPERIGKWTGKQVDISQVEKDLLPSDTEFARRLYTDDAGHQVFCSIILSGRDVSSIHRPELCLPGQGWNIQDSRVIAVPLPDKNEPLLVTKLLAAYDVKSGEHKGTRVRGVFFYWFIGKDRLTPYHWQRILLTSYDRVLHNRNHRWAYVLISANVTSDLMPQGGLDEAQTTEMLKDFVRDVFPTIQIQKPTGTAARTDS
jgi:EpsI family protein